jgi:predicted dinucleotide-binding enzyme
MKIGIVGAGKVGSGLGKLWAAQGHQICLSYSRDFKKLTALAEAIGDHASAGTPREAVAFGEVVVLTVPWGAVTDALAQAGSLAGKVLFTTVNPLKPDYSGLAIGTTTSAGEWIAEQAPGAKVVESLVVNEELLHATSRQFGDDIPTVFYCGDDADAKATIAQLLTEIGLEPIDAGALSSARLLEPAGFLIARSGYSLGYGPNVALKLLRR